MHNLFVLWLCTETRPWQPKDINPTHFRIMKFQRGDETKFMRFTNHFSCEAKVKSQRQICCNAKRQSC